MQTSSFRACEACRALKVRCEPVQSGNGTGAGISDAGAGAGDDGNNGNSDGHNDGSGAAAPRTHERPPCRRCRDNGTVCVYTQPRRTRRKRTDVRVRELEREVRQLSEMLLQQRQQQTVASEPHKAMGESDGGGGVPSALSLSPSSPVAWPPVTTSSAAAAAAPFQGHASATDMPAHPALTLHPPVSNPTPLPAHTSSPEVPMSPIAATPADPVAAGVLSMDTAVHLFHRYVTIMAPQRPFVVFPAVTLAADQDRTPELDRTIGEAAAHVRAHAPVLFLAIMTAAVGAGVSPVGDATSNHSNNNNNGATATQAANDALGMALDKLLLRVYANRIMYNGEKSLELVQALLVSANWNFYYFDWLPNNLLLGGAGSGSGNGSGGPGGRKGFDHLRFYQHLHLAATMALELATMDGGAEERWGAQDAGPYASDPLAFERTLLACYVCCSSVSLAFHRPSMLAFTPLIAKCLERLETSPQAAPTDRTMVAWGRLQQIIDGTAGALGLRVMTGKESRRAGFAASVDGAAPAVSGYVPDLSDPGTQMNRQNVTQQLKQWKIDASTCMTNALLMQYHTILCLLHECCFYNEFDPADFNPPYRVAIPLPRFGPDARRPLTPSHLASQRICLTSARALIGIFLSSPTDQLLGSPVIIYARIGYAIVVLLKIQISAALPGGAMHGLLLDSAMGLSSTLIYQYLESLMERLQELQAWGCRLAGVWLSVVSSVHAWYEAYLVPAANGEPSAKYPAASSGNTATPVLEPLRNTYLFADAQRHEGDPVAARDSAASRRVAEEQGVSTNPPADFDVFVSDAASMPDAYNNALSSTLASTELDSWLDPILGGMPGQLPQCPVLDWFS